MGTTYHISYDPRTVDKQPIKIHERIDSILLEINEHMSTYIADSELSLFNRVNLPLPITLSSELFLVMETANEISQLTDGAFDVTVGPLVNLWGFGANKPAKKNTVPDDNTINQVKAFTGYQKLSFDHERSTVTKTVSEIYVDLSAIAKGYAVDKLAVYMDSINVEHYLIDIGGEVRAKGNNHHGSPWRIAIEQPDPYSRSIQRIVNLNAMSMATSGDYRNYFEENGIRYSHTIDPTTGRPVTHGLASVTVLHESCMRADAMATAFMVMGPEKTMELADTLAMPIFMLIKNEHGFEQQYNDAFKPYLN